MITGYKEAGKGEGGGLGLVSVSIAVRMTTVATRAASMITVWVLDDDARTSHPHTGDILGAHLHTVPIALWVCGGHAVPACVHRGVHDLLLGVHRHGLWVSVLDGLHVLSAVRPVHVTVATRRDGECGAGWVLHCSAAKSKIERSTISVPRSTTSNTEGWDLEG